VTTVDWVALALLWGASLLRFPAALRSYQHRMLWGAFTALALSRVFSAAPVVDWLDAATRTEVATLGRHLTGLASATFLLAYVEVISRGARLSRARWIWPAATVVVTVLIAMFALRGGRIYWVDGAYAPGETATTGRLYLMVFDAWLMYCLGMAGVMFAGYAKVAPPLLRVGLIISAVAMAAGVINRGHVMVINVANLLAPEWGATESPTLHRATFLITIVGITVGTSIPAGQAAAARIRQARALRELRPLWAALTRQYPDVALRMRGSLQTRLVRRVVEIRDGMLALTSVAEPPASQEPREVAAWLTTSLDAARQGPRPGIPSGRIPGPDFAGDVDKETEWLRQVAAAYKQQTGRTPSPVS
jgi:hypothetical protein